MSRFRDTFKKPALDHFDRRQDRVTSLAKNRKEKRGYSFAAQRNVTEDVEDDPIDIVTAESENNLEHKKQDDQKKPKESVKLRFQKWKAEKEKQKIREHQLKEKSRQPFRVGVVHHSNKALEIAPLHPVKNPFITQAKSVIASTITKPASQFTFQPFATYQTRTGGQQHGNMSTNEFKAGPSHTTRALKEHVTPHVLSFRGQHDQVNTSVKSTSSNASNSKKLAQPSNSTLATSEHFTHTRVTRGNSQAAANRKALPGNQTIRTPATRGNIQPTTRTPATRGNIQPTTRTPATRGNIQPTTRTPATRGNIQPTTRTPATRGNIQPTTRTPATRGNIQPTTRTPATRGNIQPTTRTPATRGNIQPTTRTPATRGNVKPNTRGNATTHTPGMRGNVQPTARTPRARGTPATRANAKSNNKTPGVREATASNTTVEQQSEVEIDEELMETISGMLQIENLRDGVDDTPVKSQNHTLNETFEIESDATSPKTDGVTTEEAVVAVVMARTPKRKSARRQHETGMEIEPPIVNVFSVTDETEETHDSVYFRNILATTIDMLEARCNVWEQEQQSSGDVMTEIAHEQLLLATGMARLLIREKFAQFRGLIDNCENPLNSETTTLCSDLQGFWEMIYIQVGDIDKKFKELENLKKNNWVPVTRPTAAKVPRKKTTAAATKSKPAAPRGPSKFREFMAAKKSKEINEATKMEEVQSKTEEQKAIRPSLGARRSSTRNSISTPYKKIESPNVNAIWSASRIAKSAGRKSFTNDLNNSLRKRRSGTSSPLLSKGSSPKFNKPNTNPMRGILKRDDPMEGSAKKSVFFKRSIPEEKPEEVEEEHVLPVTRTYSHQHYAVSPIKDKFDDLFVSSPRAPRKPSLLYTPPNTAQKDIQENVTPEPTLFDIPEEPPKTRKPPTPYITKRKERKFHPTEDQGEPMADTTNSIFLDSPTGSRTRNSTAKKSSLKPLSVTPDLISWESPGTTRRKSSRLNKVTSAK